MGQSAGKYLTEVSCVYIYAIYGGRERERRRAESRKAGGRKRGKRGKEHNYHLHAWP
jgi:hypothetical protein